eukprot:gene25322-10981_t
MAAPTSFKYILIPAELESPILEQTMLIPEEKETLLKQLGDSAAAVDPSMLDDATALLKQLGDSAAAVDPSMLDDATALLKQLGDSAAAVDPSMLDGATALLKQLGDSAAAVDPSMLDGAINMQMVENIGLLPNSVANGFIGVNMYCDDQAQLKELPVNPRASQVAVCCGKLIEVRGDAFLEAVVVVVEFLDRMRKGTAAEIVAPKVVVKELTPAEAEKDAGNAAFKKGDWNLAVEKYSKAAELDSGMAAVALNNRAMAYLKMDKFVEAEADCSQTASDQAISNLRI